MSFVPVTGTATLRPADPPRDSVVEFSDERRTVALPMRAALPVLTKARGRDDVHPSVGLLSGAVMLGMRLVAAGKFEPAEGRRAGGSRRSTRPTTSGSCCWPAPAPTTGSTPPRPSRSCAPGARRRGRHDAAQRTARRLGRRRHDPRRSDLPRPRRPAATRPPTGSPTGSRPASRARRAELDAPERRPPPAGAALAAGRGRRGGARRRGRAPGAPGARRARPAPRLRRGRALRRRPVPSPTASAPGPRPTPASPCAPPPTRGRCSTACWRCACPTRSPSTPTSWSACSRPASAPWRRSGSRCSGPRAWAAT